MKLNEDQIQQVVDWVNEKLPGGWKCGFCGERKRWRIDPTVFRQFEYDRESIFFSGQKKHVVIFISCSNCGHQNAMNPKTMGIKV